MEKTNALEGLDHLVMGKLHYQKIGSSSWTEEAVSLSLGKLRTEQASYPIDLIAGILGLNNERKIMESVMRYHTQFGILLGQSKENLLHSSAAFPMLVPLNEAVILALENLLSTLEIRFPSYINPQDSVSASYAETVISDIFSSMRSIRENSKLSSETAIREMLFPIVEKDIDLQRTTQLSYGQLLYLKDLMQELAGCEENGENGFFSPAEEILIYQDFNDRRFAHFMKQKISGALTGTESPEAGAGQLKTYYKAFKAIGAKAGVRYNPDQKSLFKQIKKQFAQEALFLANPPETSMQPQIPIPADTAKTRRGKTKRALLNHSVDQTGLFLRAADQTSFMRAGSFKKLCEIVAPVISTAEKTEISPDSLRSNAYLYDEHDRTAVIRSLEKMIKWIRES